MKLDSRQKFLIVSSLHRTASQRMYLANERQGDKDYANCSVGSPAACRSEAEECLLLGLAINCSKEWNSCLRGVLGLIEQDRKMATQAA